MLPFVQMASLGLLLGISSDREVSCFQKRNFHTHKIALLFPCERVRSEIGETQIKSYRTKYNGANYNVFLHYTEPSRFISEIMLF